MVFSHTAKRIFSILFILALFYGAKLDAQTFNFKESDFSIARTAVEIRDTGFPMTIDVKHVLWDDIYGQGSAWTSRLKFKSLNSYVRFYVDHGYPVKIQDSFSLKLAYELRGYANALDTVNYTSSIDTLTISYSPDSLANYQDISIKRYNGYHRIKIILLDLFEITSANSPMVPVVMGPGSTFSKLNFIVEGAFSVQPYYKQLLNSATSGYVAGYGSGAAALHIWAGTEQDNVLPLKWNLSNTDPNAGFIATPANYELEWLYLDDYKVSTTGVVTEKTLSELAYDFRFNSTRVTVDSNGYDIPLVYQKGYLVYRVRMVRPDSSQYRYPIYSNWTLANAGSLNNTSSGRHYYRIGNAHNNDSLNWQYTVSFAEQGKHKHVLSYYDGMLKNRQSITRFNSMPGKLIATEQIYDHEGRPSISILPTPVTTGAFKYQHGLAVNELTGLPYRARDFDSLIPDTCPDVETLPIALSNSALAKLYYSPLNPDTAGFQKFVPDAEGYPFVQTIYSPGFEDRVDRQGGAGLPLQIGNGHSTTNFYVSGDQADLNRMFGLNIGLSGFYRKTVSKDPNGQLSLNYTDFKGKVMASSLFGIPDTSHLAITPNVGVPDTSSFSEDHIAGMLQQTIGNKKILDKAYFNDVAGNNNFVYSTMFTPFPTLCPDKFLSVEAKYAYTVADNCGATVVSDAKTLTETGVLNSGAPIPGGGNVINEFLNSGTHFIHKELSFKPDDVVLAVDEYMNMDENCLRTEEDFIKEEVLARQFPCATCKTLCDYKKDQMLRELWPNYNNGYVERRYGIYTDSTGSFSSNNNSIFTLINGTTGQIVTPENWEIYGNDSTNYYRYQDTCIVTLPDTVHAFGQVFTNLRELPVQTFISLFNDSIAEALLPLHPDYCNLLKCIDDTFRTLVRSIPDGETAESLGLMTIQQLIDNDPITGNMNYHGLSPYDSLSYIYGTNYSIDSIALAQAYCQCGDNAMFTTCMENIFVSQIQGQVLSSIYARDRYFQQLKTLYLANRQHFVRYLVPANPPIDCSRCEPVRMTSEGGGVFVNVIDYSNPYTGGNFGPSPANPNGTYPFMISQQFYELIMNTQYDSMALTVDSAHFDSLGNTMQALADPNSALNFATSVYNNNLTILNNAAVDYIIEKLVNCADSATLSLVRINLLQMIANAEVEMGNFKPEQVRRAIVNAGIPLTDLCHPYLISYNEVSANNTSKFGCSAPLFYQNVQGLVNLTAVKNALINIGTTYNFTLSNANNVEQQVTTALGTTSIKAAVSFDGNLDVYVLNLFANTIADANAVRFYFRTNDTNAACAQPFNASSAANLTINIDCINRAPFAHDGQAIFVDGYIGAFTIYASVTKVNSSGTSTCHLAAWNNTIQTNSTNTSNIAGCIPCTEMEELHNVFMDTMSHYGLLHYDHPYYNTSMKNFVNYALKKSYDVDDYLPFIQSCALADKQQQPLLVGYATLVFNSSANAQTFLNQLVDVDVTVNASPAIQYKSGSQHIVVVDFNYLPVRTWRTYRNFINAYNLGVQNKQLNSSFFTIDATPGLVSVIVTPAPLASGAVTAMQDQTGFTLTPNGTIDWHNGTMFQTAYRTSVTAPGAVTTSELSKGLDTIQKYLFANNLGGYSIARYQSTVNDQYYLPEKQNYLSYVDQFTGQHRSLVLDTLRPSALKQGVPAFSAAEMSYGSLHHPEKVNNLYMMNGAHDTIGAEYHILNTILNGAANHFGSQRLFSTQRVTAVEPNEKFKIYLNSDNSYWFRYFGDGDKLYNVFIYKPKYISLHNLQHYQMLSVELAPGDTAANAFKLRMRRPGGTPEIITLTGYTDFRIGNSLTLKDVLLKDPFYNPATEYMYNCERHKLNAAIYEGQVRYIQYRDSIRNGLINDFTAYVLQGFEESLISSYKTQRFNYTVYEYDRADNLIRTIPPAGVNFLAGAALDGVNAARNSGSIDMQYVPKHKKASTYEYNSLNQVVWQTTPDGGRTEFFYDRAGRVVFSQNEQQRISGRMTYTLYDAQSRIMETGQSKIACAPYFAPYPGNNDSLALHSCGYNVGGIITPFPMIVQNLHNVSNQQVTDYVRSLSREDVVLTHYDERAITFATGSGMSPQEHLRKRVATIKFFSVLQPANTTFVDYNYAMHFSYDISGNVKTLIRDYPAWAPAGQRFKRVDYDYDLISGKVNMLSYNRGFADQFYQKYDYDADNRIIEVNTSSDGVIWSRDAAYQYYQHGPLARMSLGDRRVQGVDYAYTIQGWLKAINGDLLDPHADMGRDELGNSAHARDAVALSIDYFNGDYKPIGSTAVMSAPASLKSLYNGNIPKTTAAIKPFENLGATYTYDQLNRLVRSDYAELTQDTQWNATQRYYNSYAYDADGNLQKLVRNGDNASLLAMDSIIYRYTVGNTDNRLHNVNDYVPNNYDNDIRQNTVANVSRYMYDATGNLTRDLVSGQDTIHWNHYNKVTQVHQDGPDSTVLRFDYDGSGQRYLKTNVVSRDDTTIEKGEYYVRDAQGNILAVYKADSRYELSATTVWETVIQPAVVYVGPALFISDYLVPAYSNNGGFQAYMVGQALSNGLLEVFIADKAPSYFLSNNQALYAGFLNSAENTISLFSDLRAFSESSSEEHIPLADALYRESQKNYEFHYHFIHTLMGNPELPEQQDAAFPAIWAGQEDLSQEIFGALELHYEPNNDNANIDAMRSFLEPGEEMMHRLVDVLNQKVVQAAPEVALSFYNYIALNEHLQEQALESNPELLLAQQMAMVNDGYKAGFGIFADQWGQSPEVLSQTAMPENLLEAVYAANTDEFVHAVHDFTGNNNSLLWGGVNAAYNGNFASNIFHLQNALEMYLTYQIPVTVWQDMLQYQDLHLSSHHIYGSSRLGTRDYLSGQLYSRLDNTGNQPVMDTMMLTARRPWYSAETKELIGGGSNTPWGMADQGHFHLASQIGQKQYELANHLGNVQATVSDLPYRREYIPPGLDTIIKTTEPALVSAYDYYPFGMLMPGRYVSDTSNRCMTINRSNWTTIMVDSCRPAFTLVAEYAVSTVGNASFSSSGNSLIATASRATDMLVINRTVAAGHNNFLTFDINKLEGAGDAGIQVSVTEVIDNVEYVIGGGKLNIGRAQKISFIPSKSDIKIKFTGPFEYLEIAQICTQYPVSVQHTYLVDVCDESKDRYRFGYNGAEKDNEVKGVGNSLDFGERIYDPRIGVWLSLDPLQAKYPAWSPYHFSLNNPILLKDPDGREPTKAQAGTITGFVTTINTTGTRLGLKKGQDAHNAILSLGKTGDFFKHGRPMPINTQRINTFDDKYIYTEKGGWIDMAHFMFYAGRAYDVRVKKENAEKSIETSKKAGIRYIPTSVINSAKKDPVGEAVQEGYHQEMSDRFFAKHSAYSYEDLPSDYFGADFGANYFDPNSELSLGEQLTNYFNNELGATNPKNAPNYNDMPATDADMGETPSKTNHTTKPMYTSEK